MMDKERRMKHMRMKLIRMKLVRMKLVRMRAKLGMTMLNRVSLITSISNQTMLCCKYQFQTTQKYQATSLALFYEAKKV